MAADTGVRLALASIAVLLVLRLVLAATANLAEDEAYYWLWSTHLAAGYYDHPPMIAYWIRAGTAVFGQTAFGVRFAALLSMLAGSYFLYRASLSLFRDANAALLAVLWLNATLLCNAAAIIATPDTPLAFFATLTLFALAKLIETGRGAWWYGVGAALGLAFVSKYTAVLLLPGVFVWMIATAEGRRWFMRPEPYLGALLAAALVAPVFWWNYAHDWASFAKQAQHGVSDKPANAIASIGELLGGQAGLATPLIFAFCAFRKLLCAASRLEAAGCALAAAGRGYGAGFPLLPGPCREPENPAELAGLHLPRRDSRGRSWLPGSFERACGAGLDRGQFPACAMDGHRFHACRVHAARARRASYRGKERSNRAAEGLGEVRFGHRGAGGRPRCGQHPHRGTMP